MSVRGVTMVLTVLLMSTIAAHSLRVSSTGACFGVALAAFVRLAQAEFVVADRLRGAAAGVHEGFAALAAPPQAPSGKQVSLQATLSPSSCHCYVSPFARTMTEADLFDAKTAKYKLSKTSRNRI